MKHYIHILQVISEIGNALFGPIRRKIEAKVSDLFAHSK